MIGSDTAPPAGPAHERRVVVGAVVAAVAFVAWGSLDASTAAFAASTSNGTNRVTTGSIDVGGDSSGTALFDLARMTPGTSAVRCTRVTYTGSTPADVRLHAAAAGDLTGAVRVAVEIGDGTAPGRDCAAFRARATVFDGTLAELAGRHRSFATGLGGFADAGPGESRTYRLTATLAADATQSANATADLTWEAAP